MDSDRYIAVKERIRQTECRERGWEENKELWKEVETDCTSQQKSALYQLAKSLNENAEYEDMYYSQF